MGSLKMSSVAGVVCESSEGDVEAGPGSRGCADVWFGASTALTGDVVVVKCAKVCA